ncbi:GntR family transcriptional regulator [Salipiger sp. IMCC34102]|uniref:GntR family transcriptional regulator n=1 Tax=Salipiger sp. IMCC34102 TaxID=2510647 RepID=UPI00101B8A13|nr:GntR family transcriptional regulator [Salipiger sp. IMCC34102]RYH03058.1 GntR family transcriptional regulator [Salipiger sp. IMCC34102]
MAQTLPRYLSISERLVREIAAGLWADGTRLPPEREMAADLGASVGTLRKALADLTEKGLLERRQGSGNYVRHRTDVTSIYGFFRLELPRGGGLPSARILSTGLHAAPPLAPAGWGGEGFRLRRARALDDTPVAAEEIWLSPTHAIPDRALGPSLYRVYRELFGIIVARVEDRIDLGRAPGWMPEGTTLSPGDPCCHVARTAFDSTGQIVEISSTWVDTTRAKYVSRVGAG